MQAANRVLLMLTVLLCAPLGSMVSVEVSASKDILEIAASNWHAIEPYTEEVSPLKAVDYSIHLSAGSFDPLVDEMPDSRIPDSLDYRNTGMAIVQFHHHTGEALYNLVEEFEIFVLDHLSGSAWLVRLDHPSDLFEIQKSPSVRWAGVMQPGWRISPYLNQRSDFIAVIPAADLIPEALEGLAHDLVIMGADEAWCGLHLCEIRGEIDIGSLARDGRIIWSEPTYDLILTNAVARAIVGVDLVAINSSFNLDGSGERITITDTGIDQDHPDVVGRVTVFTQFGLDPSSADTNGGHGTHVTLTIAGDGSRDSSTMGIAPASTVIVYALEHDPTGVFGRIGSIYDMLKHAEQEGSRVAVNAWGLNGNQGQYTADSRSVDIFVRNNPDFLPIFSAGDDEMQNASKILAPSTAKNVLSIGSSTTSPSGEVANFSAQGPSLDGRVKPDLVAPGVNICSGRPEEATTATGASCGTGTHSNGDPLYMSLSGSSQATAVAGGTVSLIREFIREEVGITSPTASLLKAASINGAVDLGTADIPNSVEGWGQISLDNTILPTDGSTQLQTLHDNSRVLDAGFSTLYAFDVDPTHGLDITLVWSDEAGSAQDTQSQKRLVNDLDLTLYAPDGTIYKGNVFVNGFSLPNGASDDINNVERIRLAPGTIAPSGTWQIEISHSGGLEQAYSLVVTGDATLTPEVDLTVFAGSIFPSSESPLVDDYITIRLSWFNQGTLEAGSFRVIFEDLTIGTTLFNNTRSGLDAGTLDSLTIYHTFTTIGDHDMRLTIDTENTVSEINDEADGLNNNVQIMTITVSDLGVRLLTVNSIGEADPTLVNKTLDPTTGEGMTWPVLLKHEGTDIQNVVLSITQVQIPHPQRDDLLLLPEDTWSRYADDYGPFTMQPIHSEGDEVYLNITMNDDDADLENPQYPRYAMAGIYLIDVIARYQNTPTVSHSIRLKVIVEEVKDVLVVSAGTSGLEAAPGSTTSFAISVMNVGNSPATYDIDCISENRWPVELGSSNSSSFSFEPLEILEYLPMQVRLYVPPVVDGLPAAGSSDNVSCTVTSEADSSLNYIENVELIVKTLRSFAAILHDDDGGEIGLASDGHTISVDNSELINLSHSITNTGNVNLMMTVRMDSELLSWAIEVEHGEQAGSSEVSFNLEPGESTTVYCIVLVSQVAERNESNRVIVTTSSSASNLVYNETTFIVQDDLSVALTPPAGSIFNASVNGEWSYVELQIENTGNSIISLDWSHTIAPDGWQIGYSDPPPDLNPRDNETVRIGVIPPTSEPSGVSSFNLGIYVDASNVWQSISSQTILQINILETSSAKLSFDTDNPNLLSIERDGSASQIVSITNIGNLPLTGTVSVEVLNSDDSIASNWDASVDVKSITGLAIGESTNVTVTASPNNDAENGLVKIRVTVTSGESSSNLDIDASVESRVIQGGLFGGAIPMWAAWSILVTVLVLVGIVAIRIKRAAPTDFTGDELVAPDAHIVPDDGGRREAATDSGLAADNVASGSVSTDEIASALAQSIPTLPQAVPEGLPPSTKVAAVPVGRPPAPTPAPAPVPAIPLGPPIPPTGLPPGWTNEQWQYYGHQWLAEQGQK